MFSHGHVYIRFASDIERTKQNRNTIHEVWKEKEKVDQFDDYDQPWKYFSIQRMEQVLGPVQEHYLVINPRYGKESGEGERPCIGKRPDFCVRELDSLAFTRRSPQKAALVRWSCDGSIKPVLDLGPVGKDPEVKEWDSVVLGSDRRLEVASVESRDPVSEGPEEILDNFAYENESLDGFRVRFTGGGEIAVDHTSGRTGNHRFFVVDFPSAVGGSAKLIDPEAPFDGC